MTPGNSCMLSQLLRLDSGLAFFFWEYLATRRFSTWNLHKPIGEMLRELCRMADQRCEPVTLRVFWWTKCVVAIIFVVGGVVGLGLCCLFGVCGSFNMCSSKKSEL